MSARRRHGRSPVALLCAMVLGLAACGDDGTDTDHGPDTPTPTPSSSGAPDPGIPRVDAVSPLPEGATVLTAAPPDLPATAEQQCEQVTSLAPVDEPPEVLVPRIIHRGRLVVGLDQGSNLFSFRDPITGQLSGFDVDLAREISRDIFGEPNQVEFRSLTSATRIESLHTRQVDVVIKSMSITCSRGEQVRFSAPYYQAYQRVLTVRGSGISTLSDLEGRRVCVAAGTTSQARLWERVKRVTVLSVNTWADCLVAIQQGQVDAITTDDAILVGITAQDPYLEIVGPQVSTEPYGVGIAASTPDDDTDGLVRQVNRTLERIRRDGTWDRMYRRWLSDLGPGGTSNSHSG